MITEVYRTYEDQSIYPYIQECANKPFVFKVKDDTNPETLSITIINNLGDEYTLYAYPINGEYIFNFTDVIRLSFKDTKEQVSTGTDLDIFYYYNRFSSYWRLPYVKNGAIIYKDVQVLNNLDYINWEGVGILSRFESVKFYKNYPFSVGFNLNDESKIYLGNTEFDGTTLEEQISNASCFYYDFNVTTPTNQTVRVESPDIQQEWKFELKDAPEHPFYVRWANAYGSWDYYMFDREITTNKLEDIKSLKIGFNGYLNAENRTLYSDTLVYNKEITREVTVKSNTETRQNYIALSFLPLSNVIQHYNIDKLAWEDILVEEYEVSYNSYLQAGQLEFTFKMPNVYWLSNAR